MFKLKLPLVFLILTLTIIISGTVFAFPSQYNNYLNQAAGNTGAGYAASQAGATFLDTTIGSVIGSVVGLIGFIFLGLTIYSGIQWMLAGGNEEGIAKAKKRLINGSVGVGITLCAFIIANAYFSFFEPKFLQPVGYTNITVAPYGFEQIPCESDAMCADRNGPTTNAPMFCSSQTTPPNLCAECDSSHPCTTTGYICDTAYGICTQAGGINCANIQSASQCVWEPTCIWLPTAIQWQFEEGQCVDASTNPDCGQCTEQEPFCCNPAIDPDCNTVHCVSCLTGDNCYRGDDPSNPNANFCWSFSCLITNTH